MLVIWYTYNTLHFDYVAGRVIEYCNDNITKHYTFYTKNYEFLKRVPDIKWKVLENFEWFKLPEKYPGSKQPSYKSQ